MLPQQRLELLSWVGPLVLCPIELRRVPRAVAGVYLLHVRAISHGGYPVFYVGKSDDLRRRLEEHSNDRKAKPIISAFRHLSGVLFSAAPVENRWNLDAIESGLIRLLHPPCNDQVPGTQPILVNLPPAFGQHVN